jgi:hypothetical protein
LGDQALQVGIYFTLDPASGVRAKVDWTRKFASRHHFVDGARGITRLCFYCRKTQDTQRVSGDFGRFHVPPLEIGGDGFVLCSWTRRARAVELVIGLDKSPRHLDGGFQLVLTKIPTVFYVRPVYELILLLEHSSEIGDWHFVI